jgi:hypothetical protein
MEEAVYLLFWAIVASIVLMVAITVFEERRR